MSIIKKLGTCVASLFSRRSGLAGLVLLPGILASTPAFAQAPAEQPVGKVTGAVNGDAYRSAILAHLGEVRHCVDFGSEAELQLAGRVTVNFKVAASGAVASARVKPSPLRDPKIEQCVLTLLKTWAFPKSQGGIVKVTYPFELFATSDEILPPTDARLAEVKGSLSKERIRDVIAAHINQVKTCYEQGTAIQNDRNGQVMVKFLIASTGAVAASGLKSSTLNDPATEQCITAAIKGWTFPRPEGGIVLVNYPFILKVSSDAASSTGATSKPALVAAHSQ